jgi:diguanylate cyclase (GGDEF)-like protein
MLAVHYIDIDEFKSVNDSLGQLIGDQLLKSLSISLSRCVWNAGIVARLGGDEFAIVQSGIKRRDDSTDLVTRVFDAIRRPMPAGIALVPEHGADLEQIMNNATWRCTLPSRPDAGPTASSNRTWTRRCGRAAKRRPICATRS